MSTDFSAPTAQLAAGAPWITYYCPTLGFTCKTLEHTNKQRSESKTQSSLQAQGIRILGPLSVHCLNVYLSHPHFAHPRHVPYTPEF